MMALLSRARCVLVLLILAHPLLSQRPAGQKLTLREVIDIAEDHGLAAQAAKAGLDASRWRTRAFEKSLLPQLGISGNAAQLVHGINGVLQPDGSTQFVSQSQNQSNFGLTLSQQIPLTGGSISVTSGLTRVDLFGNQTSNYYQTTPLFITIQQGLWVPRTIKWVEREQDLSASIAERQFLEAREQVAASTTSAFFDLYAADVALQTAEVNASVNATLDTLNNGRYAVGKIGENDLLQSHLALLRAQQALSGARLDRERADAVMKRLLNMQPTETLAIATPDSVPQFEIDPALAVSEAIRNQSAIQQMALQTVLAEQQVDAARYANGLGATINASIGFNQTATQFGQAYQSPLPAQTLQVGVSMPLVQWGVGHANLEAARSASAQTAVNERATREALEETARFSALQLTQTMTALSIAAQADTVGEKRFEVAKNRYLIGKIGIGDLYIAQTEKDAAVVAYVAALRALWTAYYQLRLVTLYDFAAKRRIEDALDGG